MMQKRLVLLEAQTSPTYGTVATKMHISKYMRSSPETKVWVEATTSQHSSHVAQPLPSLYEKCQLHLLKGSVSV